MNDRERKSERNKERQTERQTDRKTGTDGEREKNTEIKLDI